MILAGTDDTVSAKNSSKPIPAFLSAVKFRAQNATRDRTCAVDEPPSGHFVLVDETVKLGMAFYNQRYGEGQPFRNSALGGSGRISRCHERGGVLADTAPGDESERILASRLSPLAWEMTDRILSVDDRRVVLGN